MIINKLYERSIIEEVMIITRPEDLGALVRDRRKSLRLSQTELARRLKVSQRYISHLERGKAALQLGLALRVLRELGVTINVHVATTSPPGRAEKLPKDRRPKIQIDRLVDD